MVLPPFLDRFFSLFTRNRGAWLFILLIAILLLQIVQFLGIKRTAVSQTTSAVPLTSSTPVDIFSSQTATIRGKITQVNGNSLKITNDRNISSEFDAGRVLLINDANNLQVASNSADLQNLQLNVEVLINLLYSEGRYVVTSLTYR